MVGFSFTLYPLFAKALMASLALILTPVFVLAVTVVLAFFPVSLSTPRYTLERYTIVPFFFLYSVIFMVYSFSISRQAIRKDFEFIPCEGLLEAPYFRF